MRALLLAALLIGAAGPAAAQQRSTICGDGKTIRDTLRDDYHEVAIGEGLSTSGALMQVFTTRDGSTWTMLLTLPSGMACLLGAGESWIQIDPPEPQPETRTN